MRSRGRERSGGGTRGQTELSSVRRELPSIPSITRGAWHQRMRVRTYEEDDRREKWRQMGYR
jgi:hypothetical protein